MRNTKNHVDYEWIKKKINGHGATYSYSNTSGLANISWIYGKNFIQLFWYNIILWIKYVGRNIKKSKVLKMYLDSE